MAHSTQIQTASIIPLGIRQSLKLLDLHDTQITIFGDLLMHGPAARDVISKRTNINRTTIFKSLKKLLALGFVRKIRVNNKQQYTACDKDVVCHQIEELKKNRNEKYNSAIASINSFWESIPKENWKPKVLCFEKKMGMKLMYEDTLRDNDEKEIFCYADLEEVFEILDEYTNDYISKRVAKKIKTHTIAPLTGAYKKRIARNNAELRFCTFVPKTQLSFPGEIRMYKNRLSIASFDKNTPIGFIIESPLIVALFKQIFKHHRACISVLSNFQLTEEIENHLS